MPVCLTGRIHLLSISYLLANQHSYWFSRSSEKAGISSDGMEKFAMFGLPRREALGNLTGFRWRALNFLVTARLVLV